MKFNLEEFISKNPKIAIFVIIILVLGLLFSGLSYLHR